MKKLIVITATVILMSVHAFGQFTVSGDVQYSTKNVSLGTGLVFSEDPATILHLNTGYTIGDWGLTAFYNGHTGIQRLNTGDQYHIMDVLLSYRIRNLTIYTGPEFTYNDLPNEDNTGSGIVVMLAWGKEKVSTTFVFYTDSQLETFYYIGIFEYKLNSRVNFYSLAAYTTAEETPVYGVAGLKYSDGKFNTGLYYVFRDKTPGPMFNIGISF